MTFDLGPASQEELRARSERLIDDFLRGRSPHTERAYRIALEKLARFSGAGDMDELTRLILRDLGSANDLVLRWKQHMIAEEKAAPASVNLRLTAARSLVRRARLVGLVPWTLEVKGERTYPYRDTSGPSLELVSKLLEQAASHKRPLKATRDVAILRLLFDQGLRRKEIVGLDLEHLDLEGRKLKIRGKGRRELEQVPLSEKAALALSAWTPHLEGRLNGPVFVSLAQGTRGKRLVPDAINSIVSELARPLTAHVTPHGFRHSAITALQKVLRDPTLTRKFSRHEKLETLMLYDDNQKKQDENYAEIVSRTLDGTKGKEMSA